MFKVSYLNLDTKKRVELDGFKTYEQAVGGSYAVNNMGLSAVNIIVQCSEAEVGMGATLHSGSDAYPYIVVSVSKSRKRCRVKAVSYTRIDKNGQSESQSYVFTQVPKPGAEAHEIRLGKNGWSGPRGHFALGYQHAYCDPTF